VTRHPFCGYCGKRMSELFVPNGGFDRQTGEPLTAGVVYWQCQNYQGRPDWKAYDEPWHDREMAEVRP